MSTIVSTLATSMARRKISLVAVTALIAASLLPIALRQAFTASAAPSQSPISNLSKQSLAFEPNIGQTDPAVRFMAHAQGGTAFFTRTGVTLSLAQSPTKMADISGHPEGASPAANVVRLEFVGASAATLVTDGPELATTVNYFRGNDPEKWRTGVPTYPGINYNGLYEGVTLKYEDAQGQLKGTYTVAAGADPSQIKWRYAGATSPRLDPAGNLLIGGHGSATLLTEQAPIAWQETGGNRSPVSASYALATDGSVSFALGAYDRAEPLIIDPTLTFSTFLGGSAQEDANGVAVDSSGNVYVTGSTYSTNFPTVSPYQPNNNGTPDAFVTKFNANGTVAYSTYLGGSATDQAYGIAVDAAGNAYITGYTGSSNFPTQNAYQPTGGGANAFLTKLNATGSALLYSTYFGGTVNDVGWGVAVDGAGNAYITGNTGQFGTNFPIRNAYQATYGGGFTDAFLARLDTTQSGNASLIYSTYLGGTGADYGGGNSASTPGHGVAADAAGNAYITGETTSTNFPARNAYDPTLNGGVDAWVAKVNTNIVGDPSLIYSTYLGGSACCDYARDVDIDAAGNAYVTGYTNSANFPTLNAYSSCSNSISSPFVTKLNAAGNGLVYSTCFGAQGEASDIAVDGSGRAHITGRTGSTTFPQVNPIQARGGGSSDAFVVRLNQAGNTLAYSTYLGGSAVDFGIGVATDGTDKTYVVGSTLSSNFPTQNAYQPSCNSCPTTSDAFVSVIDDAPPTVTATPTTTATNTPINTPTNTPTNTSTRTPTQTFTPIPGVTNTSTPTRRPTFTPQPTFTPGPVNTPTSTSTPGGPSPTPCAPNFSDVAPTDYFYEGVSYLYCVGAISGYSDGTFRPYNDTTRGQLVKIVTLAENWALVNPAQNTFSDVLPGSTFYTYIETAVERQAISGYSDGTFRPNTPITRGQVCKIIVIAERWPLIDPVDPHFTDVGVDNTFYVFIETAFSHGVIGGYNDGTFRWGANATRGQLSKIVHNAVTGP